MHSDSDKSDGPLPSPLLVLTFLAGVVDAVSYLSLGRVFVANMTGNVVFLGFAAAGAHKFTMPAVVAAIAGFLVGAFVAGRFASNTPSHHRAARLARRRQLCTCASRARARRCRRCSLSAILCRCALGPISKLKHAAGRPDKDHGSITRRSACYR